MSLGPIFLDRREAGRALGAIVASRYGHLDTVVLANAPGGIPVAHEVARALDAPLDVLGLRRSPADDGQRPSGAFTAVAVGRDSLYRGLRPPLDAEGKVVIVVDDGMTTGDTMLAAVAALRARGAQAVAVAVPLGSPSACAVLAAVADDCLCLATPIPFLSVGRWYEDYTEVSDVAVIGTLRDAFERTPEVVRADRATCAP